MSMQIFSLYRHLPHSLPKLSPTLVGRKRSLGWVDTPPFFLGLAGCRKPDPMSVRWDPGASQLSSAFVDLYRGSEPNSGTRFLLPVRQV